MRKAVAGDLLPEYSGAEIAGSLRMGTRDSGQFAKKSGSPSMPHCSCGDQPGELERCRPGPLSRDESGNSTEFPVAVVKFSIFHGYPASLIAEWCGVSLGTAKVYKSGL